MLWMAAKRSSRARNSAHEFAHAVYLFLLPRRLFIRDQSHHLGHEFLTLAIVAMFVTELELNANAAWVGGEIAALPLHADGRVPNHLHSPLFQQLRSLVEIIDHDRDMVEPTKRRARQPPRILADLEREILELDIEVLLFLLFYLPCADAKYLIEEFRGRLQVRNGDTDMMYARSHESISSGFIYHDSRGSRWNVHLNLAPEATRS